MANNFEAQLKSFRDLTLKDIRYVAVEAIQDVVEGAQTPQRGITKGAPSFVEGKIPVAEADLINSLTTEGSSGEFSYVVALAGFQIGDTMSFSWTAEHAMLMELGFTIQLKDGGTKEIPGRHFVGYNAARFQEFVDARSKEIGR